MCMSDGRSAARSARRQRREEERLQREIQAREQEEALALLEGQKKRGKGIKLRVRVVLTQWRSETRCQSWQRQRNCWPSAADGLQETLRRPWDQARPLVDISLWDGAV